MGLYDEVVEVPRRTMVLFFVVDTSGSMTGSKIGTVNSAIEEIVPELKEISESNADAQIKVATLAFSTGSIVLLLQRKISDGTILMQMV